MGQEWVRALNKHSIAPDLTFFIDVPPEVSQQRIKARGGYIEMYETEERLRPIYANYLELIDQHRKAGERIVTVDGRLGIGAVSAAILQRTLDTIGAMPGNVAPTTDD
jgi:thymidylate kinase